MSRSTSYINGPVRKTRRRLLAADDIPETQWRTGAPPASGWYIASVTGRIDLLRWWDGRSWSHFVGVHCNSAEHAARNAEAPWTTGTLPIRWLPQEWIPRIWEGAVLP